MLTTGPYLIAWLVYIVSVAGMIYSLPYILRLSKSRTLILPFRLLLAALLLTPVAPQMGSETLAPALIVTGFDLLVNGGEVAARTGLPILIVFGTLVSLLLMTYFLKNLFNKNK